MDGHARRGLKIPSLLAVSLLSLGCPGEEESDTGAESQSGSGSEGGSDGSSAGTGATSTSASTSASTTTAATGEGSTGVGSDSAADGSSSDTGAPPQCPTLYDETMCAGEEGCAYYPEFGGCVADCLLLDDEATCSMFGHCIWYGRTCDFQPLK